MANKLKVKRGTNLSNITTAPEAGELIYNSNTNKLYVGNGSTAANALTAIGGTGTVDTSGSPIAQEYARFTDNNTIEGRSAAGVRTDLGLVVGTNIQAQDTLLQDIADFPTSNSGNDGKVVTYQDSDGTLVLSTPSVGTITSVTGMTDNNVLTASGSTTISGESSLQFAGQYLSIQGNDPSNTYGVKEKLRIHRSGNNNDRQLQIYEMRHSGGREFLQAFNLDITTDNSSGYTYTQGLYGGSSYIEFDNGGALKFYNDTGASSGSRDAITPSLSMWISGDNNILMPGRLGIGWTSGLPARALDVKGGIELSADDNTIDTNNFTLRRGSGGVGHLDSPGNIRLNIDANNNQTNAFFEICANASTTPVFKVGETGIVTTGTWNGTAIASAYLDADTAHLSGTQTFSGSKTFSASMNLAGELNFTGNGNKIVDVETLEGSNSFRIRNHNTVGNVFHDALKLVGNGGAHLYYNNSKKLETTNTGATVTGNIAVTGTVDGRDVASDGSKLDGIASGATATQTITLTGDVTGSGTGSFATTIVDDSHNHSWINSNTGDPGDSRLQYWQAANNTTLNPSSNWFTAIRMGHGDPVTYYSNTIAVQMTGTGTGDLYTRNTAGGTAGNWFKHWHDGNDGAGSGLDADLLDGSQGSHYLDAGNLTGTIDSDRIDFDSTDKIVRWNNGRGYHGNPRSMAIGYSGGNYGQFGYNIEFTTTSNQHNYSFNDIASRCDLYDGLQVYTSVSGGSAGSAISWTELLRVRNGAFNYKGHQIWHANNDGSGSGLDADLLDGVEGSAFLRSNTSDTIGAQLTMGTQTALVASNYGHGVFGVYHATKYQHVWSMGTAYKGPADGVSTGNVGNLYGLAWSYNPDYGAVGNNAQSKTGLNHQLLLTMNGVTKTALGDGIWTNGHVTMQATKRLYLDGGTDTYIHEPSGNQIGLVTGGNTRVLVQAHKTYINSTGANGLVINNDEGTLTNSGRIFFETTNYTTAIMQENDDFSIRTGATTGSSSGTERFKINSNGTVTVVGSQVIGGALQCNFGAVFNEGSNDSDFRVESNGQAHCLLVDAGANRVGINASSPIEQFHVGGKSFFNGQLYGGFGAVTTAGTTDWNHSTNARSGNGHTLLLSTHTNGPGTTTVNETNNHYFHTLSFEYAGYDGDGNMAQIGIPYSMGNNPVRPVIRTRYNGTWSPYHSLVTANANGQIQAGPGTAALPSYTFNGGGTSDTNTGILRTAADTIGFSTGGSTRFTMNGAGVFYASSAIQAGNAGIQIWDGTHGFKQVLAKDSTYTYLKNNDGTNCIQAGDSGAAVNYYNNNSHIFRTAAGTERWQITSSGTFQGNNASITGLGGIYGNGGTLNMYNTTYYFKDASSNVMATLNSTGIEHTSSSAFTMGNIANKIRIQTDGVDDFSFLNTGNGYANTWANNVYAASKLETAGYTQVNNSGTLLRLVKSSWTNATTHDVIHNGYQTTLGDYVYLKTSGNSTGTHGMVLSTDNYLFWGRDNLTTGAVDNSATAPMSDVCMRVDASGNALFDGDVVAYSSTIASDARLKENVKDLNYGLKDVLNMRAVSFDWIDKRNGQHDIGVIAQEIEKIIPEVVVEVDTLNSDKGTHKTVDYAKLTSVLITAIQEQQVQIDELKTKLGE